jgi:hypothetical protein
MKELTTKLKQISEIQLLGNYYYGHGIFYRKDFRTPDGFDGDVSRLVGNDLRAFMAKNSPSNTFESKLFVYKADEFHYGLVSALLDYCTRYKVYNWLPMFQDLFEKSEDTPKTTKGKYSGVKTVEALGTIGATNLRSFRRRAFVAPTPSIGEREIPEPVQSAASWEDQLTVRIGRRRSLDDSELSSSWQFHPGLLNTIQSGISGTTTGNTTITTNSTTPAQEDGSNQTEW